MAFIEMQGISKRFPGVQALNKVSLDGNCGEVHALAGENGAGKSTLMKVLAGAYQPDEGSIVIDGNTVTISDPLIGKRLGIAAIYQELSLVPDLTVAENVFLSSMPAAGPNVNWRKMNNQTSSVLGDLGFDIDPTQRVRELSVTQQQAVEIAKVLVENAKIVIMDEPTALLPEHDVRTLFRVIRMLKEKGVLIFYISHRLPEIFEIADRVTVLKDGTYVGTVSPKSISRDGLIKMMIGREPSELVFWSAERHERNARAPIVLEAQDLCCKGVSNASIALRRGEIVGVAGLIGSGKSELIRAIFGACRLQSGSVLVKGKKIRPSPPRCIQLGIGFLPADRKREGLVLGMSVRSNITLSSLARASKYGVLRGNLENKAAETIVEKLHIRVASLAQMVRLLSGGNQQKVVLGRWLLPECSILLFDEPTRGIDVGARAEIYRLMIDFVENGGAILMSSSDMQELLTVCDRIVVMSQGRITAEFTHEEATEERIVGAMF